MERRIYHGNFKASNLAKALVARFNRGNLTAQLARNDEQIIVQIASARNARSGGQTSLGVLLNQTEDGVIVQLGKQSWLGIAASLGQTAFTAIRNPLGLLGRFDDVAQDIENLQLDEQVWMAIEEFAKAAGASRELAERLRSSSCEYCGVANPVAEPRCIACGAPMGDAQPFTCSNCGYVVYRGEVVCPNCDTKLN
jgi:hypothetical protein